MRAALGRVQGTKQHFVYYMLIQGCNLVLRSSAEAHKVVSCAASGLLAVLGLEEFDSHGARHAIGRGCAMIPDGLLRDEALQCSWVGYDRPVFPKSRGTPFLDGFFQVTQSLLHLAISQKWHSLVTGH